MAATAGEPARVPFVWALLLTSVIGMLCVLLAIVLDLATRGVLRRLGYSALATADEDDPDLLAEQEVSRQKLGWEAPNERPDLSQSEGNRFILDRDL